MPAFEDTDIVIINFADNTKAMRFDLANLTTASFFTFKLPAFPTQTCTPALLEADNHFIGVNTFEDETVIAEAGILIGPNGTHGDGVITFSGTNFDTTLATVDPTGAHTVTFQDATGTVPLLEAGQTWTLEQIFSSGLAMGDAGASANVITILADPLADNRGVNFQDHGGLIPIVGNAVAGSLGFSDTLGSANLTNQTANIGSTALTNSPGAGMYRVTTYLETTSTGVGTNIVTVSWTDDVGSTSDATTILALTGTGHVSKTINTYLASGDISFATAGYTSGTFALHIRVEALG